MDAPEYDRLVALEDTTWYFRSLHGHIERELSRRIGAQAAILDAGCGTGGLIRRLGPRQGWRLTGVDLSPLALELARQRCGSTPDLRQASIKELPFANGVFDAVVSADVLNHLEDDSAALREFHRVLRPEGVMVLNVPAYQCHITTRQSEDDAVTGRRQLLEKLARAGFVRSRVTHWNVLPLPLIIARRKLFPPTHPVSDVQKLPTLVEAGLRGAMLIENAFLALFGALPAGSSLLAVADRGAKSDSIRTRTPTVIAG